MSDLQHYQHRAVPGGAYGVSVASHAESTGRDQFDQVLEILHRGKWIIVVSLLVALASSAAYIYTQEPEYQSTSLVMLSNDQASQASRQFQGMQLLSQNTHWGRSTDSELLLLRNSQELPQQVVERIQALPEGEKERLGAFLTTEEGQPLSERQLTRRVRASVQFSGNGSMLQFNAVAPTPRSAPVLANLFAEEYVDFTQEVSRSSLVASREFLEKQLREQEQELERIESQIAEALRQKGTTSVDVEGSNLLGKISQLETRRDRIAIEMQRRQATVQALRQNLNDIRPQLASSIGSTVSQEIQMVQQKLADLKAERQVALLNNPGWEGQNNPPALSRIDRQISMLEEKMTELTEGYVEQMVSAEGTRSDSTLASEGLSRAVSLKQQIASEQVAMTGLRAEREAIQRQIQRYESDLESVPGESIQMQKLQRDRQRVAGMYDFITQRLQEIRIREQGEQGYATIIAEATTVSTTQPGSGRTLVLGAFFGIMIGIGLSLLRYKMDSRILKPDQIEVMGYDTTIIPKMDKGVLKRNGAQAMVEQNGEEVHTNLVTVHDATSSATEAYRQLRTNVQFGLADDQASIVLVTSPGIGAGKSTTAGNLAVSFARSGYRTLLLDADMRRPQVHRLMSRSLEPGLYQLLRGGLKVDPAHMNTHTDNLSVITAGRVAGGEAGELIGTPRMRELFTTLRDHFDLIVVDTPPTLAVAEARQLAPKADGTLMVARAGETRENELEFAIDQLERVGARIMGVVLNGFDLRSTYGYDYRYRSYPEYSKPADEHMSTAAAESSR